MYWAYTLRWAAHSFPKKIGPATIKLSSLPILFGAAIFMLTRQR